MRLPAISMHGWRDARVLKMPDKDVQPVVVPHTELTAELLHAVIEAYVLREGTDYGEQEFSLEDKVSHVLGQLKRGEAQIVFDQETDTVSIIKS